jgi:pentose-5-phosphate-3-epimerase
MMITNVDAYLESYASAGANAITVHFESTSHPIRVLKRIETLVAHAGIALNPETPVSAIRHLWPFVQQVTVMSVDPATLSRRSWISRWRRSGNSAVWPVPAWRSWWTAA